MKLSCIQSNLRKGLATVSRAVATRSTIPETQNVLIATDNGRLKLTATNLEIAITTWIGAQIEEEGSVTIPARMLSDFINTRQSKSSEYNDFVNNLLTSKFDEFIIIGKVSLFSILYNSIKSLFF